mmetsp:Transcript_15277/g.18542  ORF Transcript_15277/g.18542 Transcript_15277/m.18542 type:complete len:82 (+) Transcript_15277:262-507(+)
MDTSSNGELTETLNHFNSRKSSSQTTKLQRKHDTARNIFVGRRRKQKHSSNSIYGLSVYSGETVNDPCWIKSSIYALAHTA